MDRERIKELTVGVEKLIRQWGQSRCGDEQVVISMNIDEGIRLLRNEGVKSIYIENANGNLRTLNLETMMFEKVAK